MGLMTIGLIVLVVLVIGAIARPGEQVMLMQYVSTHETDPAARMLKIQMIHNLDNIKDDFVRAQTVTQILK